MKLSEIMEEKNITTKKLAELTGISQRTLEAYRSGRREPKLKTGLDIARALGVDPYMLIDDVEDMQI